MYVTILIVTAVFLALMIAQIQQQQPSRLPVRIRSKTMRRRNRN
jgi:hypothetical protein